MNLIHQQQPIKKAGADLENCEAIMIMLHGRNADAEDILSLSEHFHKTNIHFVAPQAKNFSWYPYSFMEDTARNEPGLFSGLQLIKDLVVKYIEDGFNVNQIYLLGFSQGACLTLEFAARNPANYGGIFGLSGGLIGPKVSDEHYTGDFKSCPIFMGCSNTDPHIPAERVRESDLVFKSMNANVTTKLYPGMPHTIIQEEIDIIKSILK